MTVSERLRGPSAREVFSLEPLCDSEIELHGSASCGTLRLVDMQMMHGPRRPPAEGQKKYLESQSCTQEILVRDSQGTPGPGFIWISFSGQLDTTRIIRTS
ncbi:hypothetical protein H112_05280 [Trichophyton rubrum D6]|uniref:Uncharacterized protein n=3 Tax=Trichophyton TaxID=5550 RepID=F2SM69_TRIRC|nr:uncharacterized protein TERG_03028 [Trichophyton rubrum CBS 118892]EZF20249.1 hypothetical protein H100_05302 [Trichophyton rubrum MR850]EZF40813.1 hypothetical protein H102_05292 [Trichophyton rubrum CBS 100081]EZF51430.1 hypothetical protein H103_05293 [Trichophyton rubrum CBS 288.86]EZF62013.1 hypothetical protein H104_05283 [Trichophyton rubrum CBS 289.86]EZF72704.1 hypothetical protein H105_05311 [Trichophyton soudanense CBS 452.61]EZF83484.1 hypothetical protein H110_05290 [Trichophy